MGVKNYIKGPKPKNVLPISPPPLETEKVVSAEERTVSTSPKADDRLQSTAISSNHGSGGQFVAVGGGRVVPASDT